MRCDAFSGLEGGLEKVGRSRKGKKETKNREKGVGSLLFLLHLDASKLMPLL